VVPTRHFRKQGRCFFHQLLCNSSSRRRAKRFVGPNPKLHSTSESRECSRRRSYTLKALFPFLQRSFPKFLVLVFQVYCMFVLRLLVLTSVS
jgi:hypothetical protein